MNDGRAPPLKRLTLSGGADAELWLAGPASPSGVPAAWWTTLSPDEQERANRFFRAEDRALFSMTRAMLRYLLSQATGKAALEIEFTEGPFGKPYHSGSGGPHFNVSHSGCYALIGLSWSRQIGVDIERMRGTGDELSLARRFFSDAEYRALKGQEKDAMLVSFYNIWTCKEAVLKACGRGIAEHLKDFSVELSGDGYAVRPEPSCSLPMLASVTAGPVKVPEGYVGCYALW
ncbi:MAG: 4'-phosphopantetheinyl transferase superfamily protein [Beijerinckiaceae bacterium]|nr:4'-phosphopantetheinyl transferase superfamily protein [Beijerinckiaceae bacterium]MCI0736149.1 4'-phosphopantetheinyl transferase superfamily protein [Beijerinckiaceae bacterium]